MERNILYPGALAQDTDLLRQFRETMIAHGDLAEMILGGSELFWGLRCVPTAPASLAVRVGRGGLMVRSTVDATAYGSLPPDSTPLMKIGRLASAVSLPVTAPATAGNAVLHLVQAAFVEDDGNPVVLPYYNAANPSMVFAGPGNSGDAQNTRRRQRVVVTLKPGTEAPIGDEVAPDPDAGCSPLYTVHLIYGQSTVVEGDILMHPDAPDVGPRLSERAPLVSPILSGVPRAPTPTRGDTSTRIATTEFVDDAIDVALAGTSSGGRFSTGDLKATIKTSEPGWVPLNDGTIGNPLSGATTRANEDTRALFNLIWQKIADVWAPVSGGRGASADADFDAGKTIALPKALGRVLGVAGAGAGLTARPLGGFMGQERVTLTAAQMPPHRHGGLTDPAGEHQHTGTTEVAGDHRHGTAGEGGEGGGITPAGNFYGNTNNYILSGGGTDAYQTSTAGAHPHNFTTNPAGNHQHPIDWDGGGESHNNMQPTVFVTYLIKL